MKKFMAKHGKAIISVGIMSLMCVTAFAVDPTPAFDLSATMSTAVQSIVTDLLKMITVVLPIAVTLLGASIGVAYGIKFVKKLVGKAG